MSIQFLHTLRRFELHKDYTFPIKCRDSSRKKNREGDLPGRTYSFNLMVIVLNNLNYRVKTLNTFSVKTLNTYNKNKYFYFKEIMYSSPYMHQG